MSINRPGALWSELGAELAACEFDSFKRSINFRLGSWLVRSLRDRKILHLAEQLIRRGRIPLPFGLVRMDGRRSDYLLDGADCRLAYGVYMNLLWQFSMVEDKLNILSLCEEPVLGNPLQLFYKGRLISQDLALSALEINTMSRHIDLTADLVVAEIGGGYGRLAWAMQQYFRNSLDYRIFDVEPVLGFAKRYLRGTATRCSLLEPEALARVPDRSFDLVINISSFDEMNTSQVREYFDLIDRKCRGWLYVKGYRRSRRGGLGVDEFPYRSTWKCLYNAPDAFVGDFAERIYRLHDSVP